MLTPEQAKQLREAGLTAYNHNLDTSPEYYSKITSSRKYEASGLAQNVKATDTASAPSMLSFESTPTILCRDIRCKRYEARPGP